MEGQHHLGAHLEEELVVILCGAHHLGEIVAGGENGTFGAEHHQFGLTRRVSTASISSCIVASPKRRADPAGPGSNE